LKSLLSRVIVDMEILNPYKMSCISRIYCQ